MNFVYQSKRWIKSLIIGICVSLVYAGNSPADDESTQAAQRKPIIVLTVAERNLLANFDPLFVLYDDGLLIKRVNKEPDAQYWIIQNRAVDFISRQLTTNEKTAFLARLNVDDSFLNLDEYTEFTRQMHEPLYIFSYWQEGKRKTIRAYGNLLTDEEVRGQASESLLNVFDQMMLFPEDGMQTWIPKHLVVSAKPWNYPKEDPAVWPTDWPDPTNAVKDKTIGAYYFLFSTTESMALKTLLATPLQVKNEVVLINDQQYLVIAQRYHFPQEHLWRDDSPQLK